MAAMLSRYQGCIVGLAVGDALGRPTEFIRNMDELRESFGPEGVTDFVANWHPAGTFTDDTQMSLCVARALIRSGHLDLDDLMTDMAGEFVAWNRSPDNNRAPGITCRVGCENLENGVPWRRAGVAESKGCGSAMRTAPIGLYLAHDETQLIEIAVASSLLTHGHPIALASAAATSLLVSWAVHDTPPGDYPRRLAEVMRRMDGGSAVARLVERIPELMDRRPQDVLRAGILGEAWVAEEAVASALYCFCRTPTDYRSTVLAGANTVGDSDSIACIAGAISGAYNGLDAIPGHWRGKVEDSAYLHDVGEGLLLAAKRRQN